MTKRRCWRAGMSSMPCSPPIWPASPGTRPRACSSSGVTSWRALPSGSGLPDASPDHPSLVTCNTRGQPRLAARSHHDISTTHIRLDPVTDTDLPHIYRGLSDPRVVAYYGVSYDSLAACRAQMDWYAELTRTGRGAWHLIRDRHTGEPLGPSATTMPTRLTGVPSWATGSIPNTGAGVMSAALQLWLPLTYRTTDLHRLLAVVEEPNRPSARLLERAGFHYEGTARECERKGMDSSPCATTPSCAATCPPACDPQQQAPHCGNVVQIIF